MNPISPKRIVAAQRAAIDAVLGVAQTIFDGCERWADLNCQTAGAMIGETHERAGRAVLPKSPLHWMISPPFEQMPIMEKAQSYCRKAYDIAATAQADIASFSREGAEAYARLFVDESSRQNAAEAHAGIAAWNALTDAAYGLGETWLKVSLQAFQSASDSFDPAMMVASKGAKRASENPRH